MTRSYSLFVALLAHRTRRMCRADSSKGGALEDAGCTRKVCSAICHVMYRVDHHVSDLGWVDLDLGSS